MVVADTFPCQETGCDGRVPLDLDTNGHCLLMYGREIDIVWCRKCGRVHHPTSETPVSDYDFEKIYMKKEDGQLRSHIILVPLSETERNQFVQAHIDAIASSLPKSAEYLRERLHKFSGLKHLPACHPDQLQCSCGIYTAAKWLAAHPHDIDAP